MKGSCKLHICFSRSQIWSSRVHKQLERIIPTQQWRFADVSSSRKKHLFRLCLFCCCPSALSLSK